MITITHPDVWNNNNPMKLKKPSNLNQASKTTIKIDETSNSFKKPGLSRQLTEKTLSINLKSTSLKTPEQKTPRTPRSPRTIQNDPAHDPIQDETAEKDLNDLKDEQDKLLEKNGIKIDANGMLVANNNKPCLTFKPTFDGEQIITEKLDVIDDNKYNSNDGKVNYDDCNINNENNGKHTINNTNKLLNFKDLELTGQIMEKLVDKQFATIYQFKKKNTRQQRSKNTSSINTGTNLMSEFHMNVHDANLAIEDGHCIRLNLPNGISGSLFGVFDGHAGEKCSRWLEKNLFDILLKHKKNNRQILTKEGFLVADAKFLKSGKTQSSRFKQPDGLAGACGLVLHIDGNKITIANAGDCRAIIGRRSKKSTSWLSKKKKLETISLTIDHQLDNPDEIKRLLKEHPGEDDVLGTDDDPRIKGMLQPTRGFGDGLYKDIDYLKFRPLIKMRFQGNWNPPYTTAEPDIKTYKIDKRDEFLVIASDGLYQDLSREQVVELVGKFLDTPKEERWTQNIATYLIEKALVKASEYVFGKRPELLSLSSLLKVPPHLKRNLHDDITIMVIMLNGNTC